MNKGNRLKHCFVVNRDKNGLVTEVSPYLYEALRLARENNQRCSVVQPK